MNIGTELEQMKIESVLNIHNVLVTRIDSKYYSARGIILQANRMKELINILQAEKELPYNKLVFCMVRPPSTVFSTHLLTNKEEYEVLLKQAKIKNCILYYAAVLDKQSNAYDVSSWSICEETINNINKNTFTPTTPPAISDEDQATKSSYDNRVTESSNSIVCPYCNKVMSSTPGRTLHVKNKHPEYYDEYKGKINAVG